MGDADDPQDAVWLVERERDAVVAAARRAQALEVVAQRLGHPVRVGRQGAGDELHDGGDRLQRQPVQGAHYVRKYCLRRQDVARFDVQGTELVVRLNALERLAAWRWRP